MVSQLKASTSDSSQPAVSVRSRRFLHVIEGAIQVFTSTHRSFFTNVMVQALRAAGQGTPVLVVQFLKGGINQGVDSPVQLGQNLDWIRGDFPHCFSQGQVNEDEKIALRDLWSHIQDVVMQGKYALVVLDELSLAIDFGLIPETDVLTFLRDRPAQVDVILTGPKMPDSIVEIADQVTQFRRNYLSQRDHDQKRYLD